MSLTQRLFSSLSGLRWCDGSAHTRNADAIIKTEVKAMWNEGLLPCKLGPPACKQWIVGYRISKTFWTSHATAIMVGPKKPTKFRPHYGIGEIDDHD